MSLLKNRLQQSPLLLADGAWGTSFIDQGLDVSLEPADVWNLRHPLRVSTLAGLYGRYSDVVCTNTFGANAIRLAAFGLDDQVVAINQNAVQLVRDAIQSLGPLARSPLIAGVLGPARGPGASHVSDRVLHDAFQEQARCLAEAGADFFLLETMTDVAEVTIALEAIRASCDLDIVCSYAFHECEPGKFQTWAGDEIERAIEAALARGASVTGANCVPANRALVQLVETMRVVVGSAPLWLKPNAGQPIEVHSPTGPRRMYPHTFASAPIDSLLDALGKGVFGGCCGTTPADIASLRQRLDERSAHPPVE